jgi:hypothetical protein
MLKKYFGTWNSCRKPQDVGKLRCRIAQVPLYYKQKRIGGVLINVLVSSAIYCGFEHRSGQNKDYKIGICCFSAKHASLRKRSKDLLAWNQNNVSEWSDMSTHRLLFQWTSTSKLTCSPHDIAEKLLNWH